MFGRVAAAGALGLLFALICFSLALLGIMLLTP